MIAALAELFQNYFDKRNRDVIIGCIGRIERHDTQKMRADVKPLLKYTASGETVAKDYSVLPDIAVSFLWAGDYYIRPEYKNGDLVWVSFATHEIKEGLKGQTDSTGGRLFSRENAVVISGVAKSGWTAPNEFSNQGLILGHKDGNMYAHFQTDKIKIKGTLEVDGDISATGKIDADDEITARSSSTSVTVSGHTHPYTDTPAGPANTQSPTPGT